MHGSVREELENLLETRPSAGAGRLAEHIAVCGGCASEVDAIFRQSQMLRTLKGPSSAEPAAGFYARVMQRIEESAKRSIWWVFVYSPIGKRLVYGSLALSLALGTYVVAAESRDGHLSTSQAGITASSALQEHNDALVVGTADEQRAAVLANFASHPYLQRISLAQ